MGEGMPLLMGSGLAAQGEDKLPFPSLILSTPCTLRHINPSIKSAFLSRLPKLAMHMVLRYQLGIRKPSKNAWANS